MRVDHGADLRPGSVHLGVRGHHFRAQLGQVALYHGPVEADHRKVVGPEVVPPAQRGEQDNIGPDPCRQVGVPGMRQHTGPQQAHRDIHHGPAQREV